MKISESKKMKIFDKNNGRCCVCDKQLHLNKNKFNDNDYMQVDHLVPMRDNGGNEIDNLFPLCRYCNVSKGARSIDDLLFVFYKKVNDLNVEGMLNIINYITKYKDADNGDRNKQQMLAICNLLNKISNRIQSEI